MTHTPGPWEPSINPSGTRAYGVHTHADGRRTNIVNWGGLSRAGSEEGQANARLLAAAPELLRMLREARTMLKAYGAEYDAAHIALMDDIDAALSLTQGHNETERK